MFLVHSLPPQVAAAIQCLEARHVIPRNASFAVQDATPSLLSRGDQPEKHQRLLPEKWLKTKSEFGHERLIGSKFARQWCSALVGNMGADTLGDTEGVGI